MAIVKEVMHGKKTVREKRYKAEETITTRAEITAQEYLVKTRETYGWCPYCNKKANAVRNYILENHDSARGHGILKCLKGCGFGGVLLKTSVGDTRHQRLHVMPMTASEKW